jgi:hypothetical protein
MLQYLPLHWPNGNSVIDHLITKVGWARLHPSLLGLSLIASLYQMVEESCFDGYNW